MSTKKKYKGDGYVFSTDPSFKFEDDDRVDEELKEPSKQQLRILLDKKQRAGKSVTLVTGFAGPEKDLQYLGKELKSFCGTGGSVKDGEIMVQGDNREKILQWLQKNGYKSAKRI